MGDEAQPDAPGWFDPTHLNDQRRSGPRHSRPDPDAPPPPDVPRPSPRPRHTRDDPAPSADAPPAWTPPSSDDAPKPSDAAPSPPASTPKPPPNAEATTKVTAASLPRADPPAPTPPSDPEATTKVTPALPNASAPPPPTPKPPPPADADATTKVTATTAASRMAATQPDPPADAVASTKKPPADPDPDPATEPAASTPTPNRTQVAARLAGRSALALLSVVTLVLTGIAWATVGRTDQQLTRTESLQDAPNAPQSDDGATDILLVGADSRTDAQGRPLPTSVLKELRTEWDGGVNTDTIIVIRVPHNGSRAYGVSIPRDTYVSIPGYRDDKINGAYTIIGARAESALRAQGVTDPARIQQQSAEAGRRALIGAVQDVTGLKIDHYAEVNLLGFYQLTQAIGGVDVCLKHATKDKDSGADFRAGPQNVSGGDALSFVRQRKNLPRGDLDRIVRQQVFMASLARKVLSAGTLTNPARLSGMLDTVRQAIVLDKDWDIAGFAQQMQGLTSGGVQFQTIPVTNINARDDRGLSIVTVDKAQVHRFVTDLIGGPAPAGPTAPPSTNPPTPTTTGTADGTSGGGTSTPGNGVIGNNAAAAIAAPPGGDTPSTITPDGIPCVN